MGSHAPMPKARRQCCPVTAVLRRHLPLLLLLCISSAGAQSPPTAAIASSLGDVMPQHGRRLDQVPATLPACKTQLATSKAQLGTCKTQLNATTVAKKACSTKLTACAQSATAKQLSACQRRGAGYNGKAASTTTKLQRCVVDKDALTKENRKLRAAAGPAKRTAPVAKLAAAAAEPDPLVACQQQVAALQAQVDALNASLAGAQAALDATQIELDSVNAALVQRDADVAALQEQLQLCGEEQAQLATVRWQLSQLQQVCTVTDGLLNQTRDDLDRVSGEVEGLRDANATCHVELSNQGARLEDAQAELAASQLTITECAHEKASLQEAYLEASAKQFPPAEYVACANELITVKIANETNANAAGECQSQLADMERSYSECMSHNRRLLKLPGGRPALSRTTA